jgi:hypothetical protein
VVTVCTDVDFDARILAGIKRRWADFAYLRAVDAGLAGQSDPDVLEWSARQGGVLLTQDAKTMHRHALARLQEGLPFPGVVIVPQSLRLSRAIQELELLLRTALPGELENRVLRLPL